MTDRNLTPYDRGTRLEPQLWPLGDDPDSYGRVDFDNDESATVLTAYVEREGDGYAMHVAGMAEPLSLVVDGGGRPVRDGTVQVLLLRDGRAVALLGTALLAGDGGYVADVRIPEAQPLGTYDLVAEFLGNAQMAPSTSD